ncbi:MAG TPA: hypothetical protein VHV47_13230 [Opitutaceae bacterium]|jgi:uncharacterized membrane protein|nr:hypothetical protein [Opitutaceae bacterium]
MRFTPPSLPALGRLVPLVALLAAPAALAQTFTGIGDPPAGGAQTTMKAISADGSVIAGITTKAGLLSEGLSPDQGYAWSGDSITVMGYLPGAVTSVANRVSADGSVLTGSCESPAPAVPVSTYKSQAFRWTARYGMRAIPLLPGGDSVGIAAISEDGSVMAGGGNASTGIDPSGNPTGVTINLIRWTPADGTVSLGFPDGWHFAEGTGISSDGEVIAGEGADGTWNSQAFVWTQGGGFTLLGYLPGASESEAVALSGDGSTVVGVSSGQAFRWTRQGGMQGLGGTNSTAVAVSAAGRTVAVVSSLGGQSFTSFRWTVSDGAVPLGNLPGGGSYCYVTGMSAGGGILVGNSDSATGIQAFVWTPAHGIQSLADVLANSYHLDVAGWRLTNPQISSDGQTIAGDGVDPYGQTEAWKASIQW